MSFGRFAPFVRRGKRGPTAQILTLRRFMTGLSVEMAALAKRWGSNEPAHVHVGRNDLSAKFWLRPVALVRNFGFPAHELRRIRALIEEHLASLLEAWNGHIGAKR